MATITSQEVQPDIGDVINDLSNQISNLVRDNAVQRSIIAQLQGRVAELQKMVTNLQNNS
jgi:polyhydroxyalkanoate synthesis regulator phasin